MTSNHSFIVLYTRILFIKSWLRPVCSAKGFDVHVDRVCIAWTKFCFKFDCVRTIHCSFAELIRITRC